MTKFKEAASAGPILRRLQRVTALRAPAKTHPRKAVPRICSCHALASHTKMGASSVPHGSVYMRAKPATSGASTVFIPVFPLRLPGTLYTPHSKPCTCKSPEACISQISAPPRIEAGAHQPRSAHGWRNIPAHSPVPSICWRGTLPCKHAKRRTQVANKLLQQEHATQVCGQASHVDAQAAAWSGKQHAMAALRYSHGSLQLAHG